MHSSDYNTHNQTVTLPARGIVHPRDWTASIILRDMVCKTHVCWGISVEIAVANIPSRHPEPNLV